MSTYSYVCEKNHRMFETYPMGTAPRELNCPQCKTPMKLVIGAGVQVAPMGRDGIKESDLSADLAAYREMRDDGMQPESPIGCAKLKHEVEDQFDVQHRDLYQYASKETIKAAVEETKQYEMGVR